MISAVSQFNVSLIVHGKVTRQCPSTTMFCKERWAEAERRPWDLPLTSRAPYHQAKPAHYGQEVCCFCFCLHTWPCYIKWNGKSRLARDNIRHPCSKFPTDLLPWTWCGEQSNRRSEVLRSLRHYYAGSKPRTSPGGERRRKRMRSTTFLERTRKGHRQSDQRWNCFKKQHWGHLWKTGGAHMNFPECLDTISNWNLYTDIYIFYHCHFFLPVLFLSYSVSLQKMMKQKKQNIYRKNRFLRT